MMLGATSIILSAQTTFFNKIHGTDTTNMSFVAAKPLQDGYLLVGDLNAAFDYSSFYVRKIDFYGNDVWSEVLYGGEFYSAILMGNSMTKSQDSNFMLIGTLGENTVHHDFFTIKFDEYGDVLWTHNYETENHNEGNAQLIALQNGGYLIAGWQQGYSSSGTPGQTMFHIVKIDENWK